MDSLARIAVVSLFVLACYEGVLALLAAAFDVLFRRE